MVPYLTSRPINLKQAFCTNTTHQVLNTATVFQESSRKLKSQNHNKLLKLATQTIDTVHRVAVVIHPHFGTRSLALNSTIGGEARKGTTASTHGPYAKQRHHADQLHETIEIEPFIRSARVRVT
ncbi:hypothetical protein BDV25DRAFT_147433 [Aspergillus avenaceus]|uniref:Uncharacterized protein n=1 Tax=Aspergillus avenaceus TaxID=36643 RepID=A0A5N6U7H1_ASPAV|nr:hypothetical protein BDV25DRAFT_147433 [Aspergillus avenaceus]